MTTDEYRRYRNNKRDRERRFRKVLEEAAKIAQERKRHPRAKAVEPPRPRVKMCDEGADFLLEGIIKQAMLDYTLVLKYQLRGKKAASPDAPKETAEELESWFLSPYGQMLTGGAGESIVAECKRRCKEGTKKKWERPRSITG